MGSKIELRKFPFPAWLFLICSAAYHELILHAWIGQPLAAGRLLAVLGFSLGFGGALAFLISLIPRPGLAKGLTVAAGAALTVIWLTEYFLRDAYQTFMPPATIFGGAEGVAREYLDLVLSLLARNLWRIALLLAPTVLYALFARSGPTGWKLRGCLAAFAAGGYLLGLLAVYTLTADRARLSRTYDFDSAVDCFGLNLALTLEAVHALAPEQEPAFVLPPEPSTQPEQTQPETQTEQTEPEIAYAGNVLELDFAALAQSENDPSLAAIYAYLATVEPSAQNAYTGLFAGKNLILITAEAFTQEVIDPERTPTLYRMATQGIQFTDYYQPAWGASTTGGEFSNLVGLVPTNGGMCMKEAAQQDLFLTMGHQLQAQGYWSAAYHNHNYNFYDRDKTHTHLGYDQYLAQYGGLEGITPVWPESDLEMIDITVPQYIGQQPFSVYYMTVSGHCMYSQTENAMTRKHYDEVADMDCSEAVKSYHACRLELEAAMNSLIKQLEAAGIADDTVVVLATDHYPYGLERSATWQNTSDYLAELYGVEEYDNFIRDHNALIIWSGCLEGENIVVDEPVYSLDILPTLSNLFGVPYDSRLLVGRDVFSQQEPLVLWPDHSWKTERGLYDASTGQFTPAEGQEEVSQTYIDGINAVVSNKITYSRWVLDQDFFNAVSEILNP